MTTQSRKRYSDDFKRDAVALVTEQGYKISEAARRLGINATMLSRWKQAQEQTSTGSGLSDDERKELAQLRRENRELKLEKEILKKASAFFAKEMN